MTILQVAEQEGVGITAPCGGRGRCGRCLVVVEGECSPPSEAEESLLSEQELKEGYRLACMTQVLGDVNVTVPLGSQSNDNQVLSELTGRESDLHPNAMQRTVELPEPSLEDQRSDCVRLAEGLGLECSVMSAG
ncbi:MAG: 2Fe-2S iron-sulfur cluster binding domain-containing protein [Armatimonadetes bacterium]|nr:2Fe-2S iron-sulfur cluster binding domain-containing protein [Armatimonadota bacterium]